MLKHSLMQKVAYELYKMGQHRRQPKKVHHKEGKRCSFLGKFGEAPPFMQDNEHIVGGYRIGYSSTWDVLKTVFMIHNETVNIWTHLIGAIIVIFFIFEGVAYSMEESHVLGRALISPSIANYRTNATNPFEGEFDTTMLCQMLNQDLPEGQTPYECSSLPAAPLGEVTFDNTVSTWPIMVALLGGAICLGCSTVFHLMYPMSEKAYKIALGLDFAGIGINMAFSPVPAFYYTMHCRPGVGVIYISIIVIAGTISFLSSLTDWLHRKENFVLKSIILSFSATVCLVGLIHIMINEFVYGNYGDGYTIVPSLPFYLAALVSYLIGFLIYGYRCPERYKPGHFDICGHSHQLWHVCVFTAIIMTYLGSLASYEIRAQWATCPT